MRKFAPGALVVASSLFFVGCVPPTSAEAPEGPGGEAPTDGAQAGAKATAGQKDGKPQSASTGESSGTGATPAEEPAGPQRAPRPEMSGAAKKSYAAGQKSFARGDLQGARKQYEKALSEDPKAYEAALSLGAVEEHLGAGGKAAKAYQASLAIVPDYEPAIVAYAMLMARQGNYDSAVALLQKKANLLGPNAQLLAAESEVRSLQGRSGDAQSLAQQALKVDPTYKPAMVALARDHYRARRIDLALYALTGILDGYGEGNPPRDKNNAEARLLRGLIYSERGMRGPAMEEMEKALLVRPDLVDAHLVLATYIMEAGNAKEARTHLEKAIRYDNKNVAAHLQLGDAYRLLNRPEDARRELEWVLAADPNQGAAHYNLGLLFLLNEKTEGMTKAQAIDKAIEHLEAYKARAQRGGPDDVDDLLTRAKTKKALLKATEQQGNAG